MNVDKYIEELDSPMKEIVMKLRRIVTEFSKGLKEELKWRVPTYSHNRNICSIMAHRKHVNFQLMQGAHMDDAKELEGTGRDMRHMKFFTPEEIDTVKIEYYLQRAMDLDNELT